MLCYTKRIHSVIAYCSLLLIGVLAPFVATNAQQVITNTQQYEANKVLVKLREELPNINPYTLYESMNSFRSIDTNFINTVRELNVLGFERALKSLITAPGRARISRTVTDKVWILEYDSDMEPPQVAEIIEALQG